MYTTKKRAVIVPPGPSIAYVPLTKGVFALIDREDAGFAEQHNWTAHRSITNEFYATTCIPRVPPTRSYRTVRMHRMLLGMMDSDLWVDHANGRPLDNRRCNIRPATTRQNACNRRGWNRSKSGIKGVTRKGNRWAAQIQVEGRNRHLGYFTDPEEAREVYNRALLKFHGEFARLSVGNVAERLLEDQEGM